MAQQHQPFAGRPFSPMERTNSPHQGPYHTGPPPKRQRLSPPPAQYGSPGMGNISLPNLPNQIYSSPNFGAQPNGNPYNNYNPNHSYSPNLPYIPNSSYSPNTIYSPPISTAPPQYSPPPPTAGPPTAMPPPDRPNDRPTDLNELGDVLFGVGVDLKEEEAALMRSGGSNNASFHDQLVDASSQYTGSTKYPFSQDNVYSRNVPGGRGSFYGAGTFNQPAGRDQTAEEIAEAEQIRATRRNAEIKQYHLSNPFLNLGPLHKRLKKESHRLQVNVSDAGILYATQANMAPHQLNVFGPDNNEVLKVVNGENLLRSDAGFLVEALTLFSTAAEERVRQLVEDAAVLAKARKTGSHGITSMDLTGFGTAGNAAEVAPALPTPDYSAVSPKANPLKRSYTDMNGPLTPVSNNSQPPQTSASPTVQSIQKSSKSERTQEEERLAKRRHRDTTANSDASRAGSMSFGAGDTGSPALLGETAPEIMPRKSVLKKDGKKGGGTSDAQLNAQHFATSNKTMNMALGLSGAMGKKLSWMTKGADTGPTNPFLARPAANSSSSKAAATANGVASSLPKERIFGEYRDDLETGPGIQVRDVVSVLEVTAKEKKALQKVYQMQEKSAA